MKYSYVHVRNWNFQPKTEQTKTKTKPFQELQIFIEMTKHSFNDYKLQPTTYNPKFNDLMALQNECNN